MRERNKEGPSQKCPGSSSWPVLGQDLPPLARGTLRCPGIAYALATYSKPAHRAAATRAMEKRVMSGRTATLWKTHSFTAGLQAQMVSGVVSIRGSWVIPGGEGPNDPCDYPAHSLNISVHTPMESGPAYPNNFPNTLTRSLKNGHCMISLIHEI